MEFNDVRLQYEQLSEEIDAAISGVLSSGRYILGPEVAEFEGRLAACMYTIEGSWTLRSVSEPQVPLQ